MRRRDRGWISSALLLVVACAGGQSGDDGRPVSPPLPESGADRDSGPDMQPDAGGPIFVLPGVSVPDSEVQVLCASGVREPGAGDVDDLMARVSAAPYHCVGGEGFFNCSCDGTERLSRAAECVGALREACGKEPDPLAGGPGPTPTGCESSIRSRVGRCELERAGEYSCRCEGASKDVRQEADSCESALWAVCATTCEDDNGSCHPDPAALGHYTCDCAQYDDGIARNIEESTCDVALIYGCTLDYDYGGGCNEYSGFCDRADDEYACTCSDGTHGRAVVAESRWAPCRFAVEQACGDDAPPGKQCSSAGNGYSAHCVQPIDDTAQFRCECVFGESEGTESDVDLVTATSCNAAMASFCPEIAVVNDAATRERVCDYYDQCGSRYLGFEVDACKASTSDACVACTDQALDMFDEADGDCPVSCVAQCQELVAKDVSIAACWDLLEATDKASTEANCLCAACWPEFGECLDDAGCAEMLDCVSARGCIGQACATDATCGPVIMKYYGTHSLGVLLRLGDCPSRDFCRQ